MGKPREAEPTEARGPAASAEGSARQRVRE